MSVIQTLLRTLSLFVLVRPRPPRATLFPYTTLFRSCAAVTVSGYSVVTSMSRVLGATPASRSEAHTSELQSHVNLVCRLLLEKQNRDEPATNPATHDMA